MKPSALPESRHFTHEAMNTVFTVRLVGEAAPFDGIARECCELLDNLENKLSRFVWGSDISRINSLAAGETLRLSDDAYHCLQIAARAYGETGGLFDVSLGRRIAQIKAGGAGGGTSGRLLLHPDEAAITCETPGREVDLGGIGKGYALDRLRELLLEWEVAGGMLQAGGSTLLAFGPQSWPVELDAPEGALTLDLCGQALSASGTEIQGHHIVHPADDDAPYLSDRVWALAESAAVAETWSTAIMLMTYEQAVSCLGGPVTTLLAAYIESGGKVAAL